MKQRKLPVHLIPHEDEILSSWIMRLCHKLQTKYHTFFDYYFPNRDLDTRDIDLNMEKKDLEKISRMTFLKFSDIYRTSLKSYYPYLSTDESLRFWVLSKGSFHRTTRNNFTAFCPGCFKKDVDPYFRKSWRLVSTVSCIECNIKLLDECPNCFKPVNYLRLDIGRKEKIRNEKLCICSNCKYDLRNSKIEKPAKSIHNFQKALQTAIKQGYLNKYNYSHQWTDIVYLLMTKVKSNMKVSKEFDKKISTASQTPLQSDYEKTRARYLHRLNIEERYLLLQKVSWLLTMEDEKMVDTLKEMNTLKCFLVDKQSDIPYWFYQLIDENLGVKFSEWKKQNNEHSHMASYNKLGKKLIKNLSSQK